MSGPQCWANFQHQRIADLKLMDSVRPAIEGLVGLAAIQRFLYALHPEYLAVHTAPGKVCPLASR